MTDENIEQIITKIALRIKEQGDKPFVTVERQLQLLAQLTQFGFGRFLLCHQGINGYWTHYMLTQPTSANNKLNDKGKPLAELEHFILNSAPTMLATQQRFKLFLQENQKQVKPGARLACIPCGLMGELLYLHYQGCENITLVGLDYDQGTLKDAASLAHQMQLSPLVELNQGDAWAMKSENEFDLISSNGLTIYEPDDNKVIALYRLFFNALKDGGKLVTSFLTPPPTYTEKSEWDMAQINQEHLLLQKIIFADIIEAKWQCYRSTMQVQKQLELAGFDSVEFIYDQARMFPTVVANKGNPT